MKKVKRDDHVQRYKKKGPADQINIAIHGKKEMKKQGCCKGDLEVSVRV